MRICKKCGKKFKSVQKIDGKRRVLSSRKFCLDCSPFNQHNTKNFLNPIIFKNIQLLRDGKKMCSTCQIMQPIENFYIRKNLKGLLTASCKSCMSKRNTQQMIENKKKAIEHKGGKCIKCGYNKYYGALDFHHRDPNTKERGFSHIPSFEKAKPELDKCDLLCSNCHRELHGNLRDGIA